MELIDIPRPIYHPKRDRSACSQPPNPSLIQRSSLSQAQSVQNHAESFLRTRGFGTATRACRSAMDQNQNQIIYLAKCYDVEQAY